MLSRDPELQDCQTFKALGISKIQIQGFRQAKNCQRFRGVYRISIQGNSTVKDSELQDCQDQRIVTDIAFTQILLLYVTSLNSLEQKRKPPSFLENLNESR